MDAAPGAVNAISGRRGFNLATPLQTYPIRGGRATVQAEELDRIDLNLGGTPRHTYTGYLRVAGGSAPLPIGSSLNASTGAFTWMPGAGFVGTYDLVFVRWSGGQAVARQEVRIVLNPQGSTWRRAADGDRRPLAGGAAGRGGPVIRTGGLGGGSGCDDRSRGRRCTCGPIRRLGPIRSWIGAATYGGARPDVAAVYGDRFLNSG